MTDPRLLSPEELAAMRARCDAATEGPWTMHCRDVGNPENDPAWPKDRFLQFEIDGPEPVDGRGEFLGPDADFVAHSRTDEPALLSHIAAQDEALAKMREERDEARQYHGAFLSKKVIAETLLAENVQITVETARLTRELNAERHACAAVKESSVLIAEECLRLRKALTEAKDYLAIPHLRSARNIVRAALAPKTGGTEP